MDEQHGPQNRWAECTRMPGSPRGLWRAAILMVLPGLLAGCAHFGPQERVTLAQASQLYSSGEITSATVRLDRLIADFGGAAEIGEAYYLRGLCRAQARQSRPAVEDFQQALRKSKRHDVKTRALVSLGTLAYRRGDWAEAAEWYGEALPRLANKPPKDEILYCTGIALQRIGRWRESARRFADILHKFRGRPIAAEARRMAMWRHDYYAIQLGAFRDSDNAARAVYDWRERRVDAVQENLRRQGEALWVVMTGRYRTYAEATAGLQRIRKLEPTAHIIP